MSKIFNLDGWSNFVTGLGGGRDKNKANQIQTEIQEWATLTALFRADPMGRRVCEVVPHYALRENPTFSCEDNKIKELLEDEEKRLNLVAKVKEAWVYANIYGGCALVIGADGESTEPLDPKAEIKFLRVVDRTQINYFGEMDRDFSSENWGEPSFYQVTPINGSPMPFHHSRIVKIHGENLPRREYVANQYWGDSVFTSIAETLGKYAMVQDAMANLVIDYRQLVYKFNNLEDLLQNGQGEFLQKRVEMMDAVSSIINAKVLDGDESLEIIGGGQTSGMGELADRAIMRVCAERGIPHTVMLGDSAGGLGSTGESERLDFNNLVESQRQVKAVDAIKKILDQCLRANNISVYDYEMLWPSLWLANPKEELEARRAQSEVDRAYVDMGLPEDVVLRSRFGGATGYSFETQVPDEVFDMIENTEEDLTVGNEYGPYRPNGR